MKIDIVKAKVDRILAEVLQDAYDSDDISENTDIVLSFAMDSMTFIEFLVKLEDEFYIDFDFEEITAPELYIYGNLLKYVLNHIQE